MPNKKGGSYLPSATCVSNLAYRAVVTFRLNCTHASANRNSWRIPLRSASCYWQRAPFDIRWLALQISNLEHPDKLGEKIRRRRERPTFYFAILLIVAFVLRLGAATYWQHLAHNEGRLFRLGDSHSYWVLASQLGQGLPYQYGSTESRIFRAPLYPLLLAPVTLISDEQSAVWWARVLGCALGTVSVGLIGLLALRLGGTKAALIATGLAAVYPSAVGMSTIVLSEAVFMPLMIGYLLAWQSAWAAEKPPHRWVYGLLAGTLAGAAVLARPSWLLFVPFAWGLGALVSLAKPCCAQIQASTANRRNRVGGRKAGLRPAGTSSHTPTCSDAVRQQLGRHTLVFIATILGLSLAMSPWWIRSAAITGRFVPTTLQVGPSLLDGLHPGASGASDEGMAFMQPIIAEQMKADQQQLTETNHPLVSTLEFRINARAQGVAIQWAQEHPVEVLALAVRKFQRIWSLWPDGGDINSTPLRLAITVSSFSVLLLAFLFNFLSSHSRGWFYWILWLPSLYFTLLHMVFVGSIRYREPALFVLIAVAACAVARLMPSADHSRLTK